MPSSATITATTGPGSTVTAIALTDIKEIKFQLGGNPVLFITMLSGQVREFSLAATTTITATIASGVMALTVSQ